MTRRERARAIARLVPDCAVLVARLARDSRVSRRHKILLAGLGAYLALPVDVVPDFLPVVGQLDDALVLSLALRAVVRAHPEVVRALWPGPESSLAVVLRATGAERTRSAPGA